MSVDKTEKSERKQRSDKGAVMATRRDLICIAWIADQYAARVDQIQQLLSRYPDEKRPFKSELIAETTVKDQISRWRRAGWIEYKRVLADEPGYAWVTRKGLQFVGRNDIYTAHMPATTRLDHIYAVNQLRLWLDKKYAWKSERRYRSEQTAKTKKGESLGPIPDGILLSSEYGFIAIEVELSAKKPADIQQKLVRLVRHYITKAGGGYGPAFPAIWFYVPSAPLVKLIETARQTLTEDEQERISVSTEDDLIASTFR